MSTRPFRFVHASDFHLEQPLMGVAEVPDHLRDLFLDAPYTAAGKLFEAVLAEDADFVVLSGDMLHPRTPARGGRCSWSSSSPGLPSAGSASIGRAARSIRPRPGPPPSRCRKTSTSFRAAGSRK